MLFKTAFNADPKITGIITVILSATVVYGGLGRIAKISEITVPIIAGLYLLAVLYIIIIHIQQIPMVIILIFDNAFRLESIAGGGLGYTINQAFRYGVARGLFSNEAGMGSAPNAAAMATVTHPVSQGLLQMLGVFIDTIVVCTATATIILLSGAHATSEFSGIELTQAASYALFGDLGPAFIAIAIFIFAYTTIIANSAYAEMNIYFISKRRIWIHIYRLFFLSITMWGALSEASMMWELADLFNVFMASLNLTAILFLSKKVIQALIDYEKKWINKTKKSFCIKK